MPLRSVEAATREDAIAAAREQFGPSARVIGVRRVRSGGVLGFFTTERYVAEVEPGPAPRRTIGSPAPSRDASGRDVSIAERAAQLAAFLQEKESDQRVTEIAELFSETPGQADAATYSRTGLQRPSSPRPAAPARTPSWEDDWTPAPAAPSFQAVPSFSSASPFAAASSAAAAPSAPAASSSRAGASFSTPVPAAADEPAAESSPPSTEFPRASFARAVRNVTEPPGRATPSPILRDEPPAEGGPSPFTAALARMVAGDREVRQAVQDALDSQLAGDSGSDEGPWIADTERGEPTEMSTGAEHQSTGAEHQEEKPVSELETTTGASPTGASLPPWAAQTTASTSSREDAIAQILRTALAQNHTDEVLADILRKVMADASTEPTPAPAAAPIPAPAPAPAEPLWAPVEPTAAFTEPVADVVVPIDLSVATPEPIPVIAHPVLPADVVTVESAAEVAPIAPTAEIPASVLDEIAADEPIWAEVVLHEPAPAQPMPTQPVPTATVAMPVATPVAATLAQAIRAQIMGGFPAPAAPVPAPAVEEPPVTVEQAAVVATSPVTERATETPVDAAQVQTDTLPEPEFAPEHSPNAVVAEAEASPESADLVSEDSAEEAVTEEAPAEEATRFAIPELARTASDPAPLPADATTIMPALSLLPPLPGARRGGRPPVPPSSRPAVPPSGPEEETPERPEALATVTRLPGLAPDEATIEAAIEAAIEVAIEAETPAEPAGEEFTAVLPDEPEVVDHLEAEPTDPFALDEYAAQIEQIVQPAATVEAPAVPEIQEPAEPQVAVPAGEPGDVADRLRALGIAGHLLGAGFAEEAERRGTYAALTSTLALRLPEAPRMPTGAGEVLFVVGPGVATLRAARSLAASVGLHPDCVQWASRGELAGLAPQKCRMSTIDDALDRRQEAIGCGTVTIVAVDAPLRTDAYWMGQMLAVWTPVAVWAVVEATRKPEDLGPWLDELPRVDALVLQDTDLSADPAAVLERVSMPVALLDGVRATPHRWASLLCERLESAPA